MFIIFLFYLFNVFLYFYFLFFFFLGSQVVTNKTKKETLGP